MLNTYLKVHEVTLSMESLTPNLSNPALKVKSPKTETLKYLMTKNLAKDYFLITFQTRVDFHQWDVVRASGRRVRSGRPTPTSLDFVHLKFHHENN